MASKKRTARAATKAPARKKAARKARKRPATKKAPVLNVNRPGSEKSIPREKYDLISAAVLAVVPRQGDGVPLSDLAKLVEQRLSTKERSAIGSVGPYVTTVKVDLEARRRIERVPGSNPQRLRRIR